MTTVLVVDDEFSLARALAINLRAAGYVVVAKGRGDEAAAVIRDQDVAVVILDLGLPDVDGIEVLKSLRAWSSIPVIVLSARSTSDEKVLAFDAGADDYVTKPFDIDELIARVRAAARRGALVQRKAERPIVDCHEFVIDLGKGVVTRNDVQVRLTPTEWHLIEVLANDVNSLVTQSRLLTEVWGPGYENDSQYLRVYMAALRRKLEVNPSRPRHIVTEIGIGYRLVTDPDEIENAPET